MVTGFLGRERREETQTAAINPDDRHTIARRRSNNAQKGAVSSDHAAGIAAFEVGFSDRKFFRGAHLHALGHGEFTKQMSEFRRSLFFPIHDKCQGPQGRHDGGEGQGFGIPRSSASGARD